MRSLRLLLALPLFALLAHSPAVEAKPNADAASEEPKLPEIVATGIAEFDAVFMQAKDIHQTIDTGNTELEDARKGVNKAAGVAEHASLDTGMAAIKAAANGKLKLDKRGAAPRVKAAAGAPQTTRDAAAAINKLLDSADHALAVAKVLGPQAKDLASTAAEFPGKLGSMGLHPMALAQASKKVGQDLKATAAAPDRVDRLAKSADEVFTALTNAFTK